MRHSFIFLCTVEPSEMHLAWNRILVLKIHSAELTGELVGGGGAGGGGGVFV